MLWPPGWDFDGASDMLRTFDLAETKVPLGGSGFGPTIEVCGPELKTLARRKLFESIGSVINEAGFEVTLDFISKVRNRPVETPAQVALALADYLRENPKFCRKATRQRGQPAKDNRQGDKSLMEGPETKSSYSISSLA
jgi:hypothetical protein